MSAHTSVGQCLCLCYSKEGEFCKDAYWIDYRYRIPTHYAMYLGDCASKKPASANVETVFSGAKKFSDDATTAHDDLLGGYVQNHINYTYEWLRPLVHDIVCAYMSIHGPEPDMGYESEGEVGGDED